MFQEGLYYFGEAFVNRHTNIALYDRVPRYFWLLYEVVRQDNSILTPDEMNDLIKDTGIETVQTLFDNRVTPTDDLQTIINTIMAKIETGEIVAP